MPARRVAVIGASCDRAKFGNKAVRAYLESGFEVFPVNPNESEVEGLPAYATVEAIPSELDLVSVYVSPAIGIKLLPGIASKSPKELWLNPGAANADLLQAAASLKLHTVSACSIIALGRSPGEFPDA